MGLDTVELIPVVEEEFDIKIENALAEKIETVGDIHSTVLLLMSEKNRQWDDDAIWERVKNAVVSQLGVKPEEITRNAHIVYDLRAD